MLSGASGSVGAGPGIPDSAWSRSPPPLSDASLAPLLRSPVLRGPASRCPGLRCPLLPLPALRSPLLRSPILGWVRCTAVREPGVPRDAFRLFGPGPKNSGRPGCWTPARWTAHARSSSPRHPACRSPRPCSPLSRSPRVGAERPFAVRRWLERSFAFRTQVRASFRNPGFPAGLGWSETSPSVRANSRVKSIARIRTRDL